MTLRRIKLHNRRLCVYVSRGMWAAINGQWSFAVSSRLCPLHITEFVKLTMSLEDWCRYNDFQASQDTTHAFSGQRQW